MPPARNRSLMPILGAIGAPARAAIPVLEKIREDPLEEPRIRSEANRALERIQTDVRRQKSHEAR